MGVHIMKQSNGKFCRWSPVTNSFTHFNYTRAEMFRDLKAHHLAGWAVEMNERLDRAEATGDSAHWESRRFAKASSTSSASAAQSTHSGWRWPWEKRDWRLSQSSRRRCASLRRFGVKLHNSHTLGQVAAKDER